MFLTVLPFLVVLTLLVVLTVQTSARAGRPRGVQVRVDKTNNSSNVSDISNGSTISDRADGSTASYIRKLAECQVKLCYQQDQRGF